MFSINSSSRPLESYENENTHTKEQALKEY